MKKKQLFVIPALLLSFFLTACQPAPTGSVSGETGAMRQELTAMSAVQEMGIGINLGNTFEAYWEDTGNRTTGASTIGEDTPQNYETCWGAVVTTQECIDGMKNAGFSTVRLPVYWGNMMQDDGKFVISDEYFDRVQEVIDYCRKQDLYVIVNIHHYDGFLINNFSKEEVLEITESLWTQIAERYRDYSDYVVFEGFNESLGQQREGDGLSEDALFTYVNELNQTFVDAVRSTGGNNAQRLLIISGYNTNIDKTTDKRFVMPTDTAENKLMVSVHYIDNICFWMNKIGGQYWLDYSKSQCELLKSAFTDKGIPVFIGECTAIYPNERYAPDAMHRDSAECLEIMLDMTVDYGFVPVIWDVNDNMYSRTEYKLKSDSDQAVVTKIAERIANGK